MAQRKKNKGIADDYYPEIESEKPKHKEPLSINKVVAIASVIIVIIIVFVLIVNLAGQKNNLLFFDPGGEKLSTHTTISKDGTLIDSLSTDGNILHLAGNPNEPKKIVIKTSGITLAGKNVSVQITSGGKITVKHLNQGDFYIDDNGGIHLTINPIEDMNIGGYYDENTGEFVVTDPSAKISFEFVIDDPSTGETTIVELPGEFIFSEFNQSGCVALSRNYFADSAHFGYLDSSFKIRVSCDSPSDLVSSVTWNSERMGNVEVVFGNFNYDSVLFSADQTVLPAPAQDVYTARVIFTPFMEFAGKKASFTVNFGLGDTATSQAKVDYDVVLDNLDQCVKISPQKIDIPAGQNSAVMNIDVSSCASDFINFSLCEGDALCSGGTEGGIDVSPTSFTLKPKGGATKTINISRRDIPGAYGIPITASASGIGKSIIDEKLVTVESRGDELLSPDKFVISMMGGAKDSAVIKNISLAEDVQVEASICSAYKSSLGVSNTGDNYGLAYHPTLGTNSWWRDLATNQKLYSGEGFYQAAIVNTLSSLDYIRIEAQYVSASKNADIKTAYLANVATANPASDAVTASDKAVKQAELLKNKVDKANDMATANLTSQVVSLTTSLAGLSATLLATGSNITTDMTMVQDTMTESSDCAVAATAMTTAQASAMTTLSTNTTTISTIAEVVSTMNSLYGLYNQIDSFTNSKAGIDAQGALDKSKSAQAKLQSAKDKIIQANADVSLALKEASVDSFSSASQNDEKANEYLQKAKQEMVDANQLVSDALSEQIAANTAITLAIQDLPDNSALIGQAAGLVVQLTTMLGVVSTNTGIISAQYSALHGILSAGLSAASAYNNPYDPAQTAGCKAAVIGITAAQTKLSSTDGMIAANIGSITSAISAVNMVYTAFSTYQSMSNDYTQEFSNTQKEFSNTMDSIYAEIQAVNAGLNSLPPAISSSDWLAQQEAQSSKAAGYDDSAANLGGEFNKKRLTALIGNAISNGFVNGAYEGGVYTTKPTNYSQSASPLRTQEKTNSPKINLTPKPVVTATDSNFKANFEDTNPYGLFDDCENTVNMTLPDYSINLINDAQPIIVSAPNVSASWDFSEAKVFDVFESQEAGIVFANSGLKNNSYGIVELSAVKHGHANPTIVTGQFGPFNIPDSASDTVTYKYHFKFNVAPRSGALYVPAASNDCINGLVRGQTGASALPNTILSWDWNSVSGLAAQKSAGISDSNSAFAGAGGINEPFLDATQLSILLSKKMGSLASMLTESNLTCPINPAKNVLDAVKPVFTAEDGITDDISQGADPNNFCFLPLTTRAFDNKPALYYYLQNSPISNDKKWLSDSEVALTPDDFLSLVDFNVNLMRDGYGVDFQYDFAGSYGNKILQAAPSFLDPLIGSKKYFEDSSKAYFSSEANFDKAAQKWAVPDAGKYRVRMKIDFLNFPLLYRGATPSANIVFDLYSLEPLNSNYSPAYYTPIDGFTGLNANNNRQYYGTSLANSIDQVNVLGTDGVYLSPQQKNSLIKISFQPLNNPGLMNASPFLRSKEMELSYNYNTALLDDSSSYLLFSPSIATPLLFELDGTAGNQTNFFYSLSKNMQAYAPNSVSLFPLTYVGDCSDLAGSKLSKYANESMDMRAGNNFGVALPVATTSGKTYLKTVAFIPIGDLFGLKSPPVLGAINSPDSIAKNGDAVSLGGISGMAFNDAGTGNISDTIGKIYSAVKTKSICVSHSGARDTFYWPTQVLFNKTGASGTTLSAMETAAKADRVK